MTWVSVNQSFIGKILKMKMDKKNASVCLVGHPYAPIGMGEHIRSTYRALRSVAVRPGIKDIYRLNAPDADARDEFKAASTDTPGDISIFHINGDEVEQAIAHLSYSRPWSGYKVIYPAWELARYPEEWAAKLDTFDEIWAPSRFIKEAVEVACSRPVFHMPLACEVLLSSFLSRRHFGIPESDYTFLFFFDIRSYSSRKNPQAVVDAFRSLLSFRPSAHITLVLKVNGAEQAPQTVETLRAEVSDLKGHVTILDQEMSDNEIKNLVRCCDCFVSLHRSEGYGRGIAEAMYLGKPVIATAYSGNMDFMAEDKVLGVGFELVAVKENEYPHWQDQVWANPDKDQAVAHMIRLVDNPRDGRELGQRASRYIRTNFDYRTIGLRYLERLDQIFGDKIT